MLRDARRQSAAREAEIGASGIPPTRPPPAGSATTMTRSKPLVREAIADGFTHFKMKVGSRPRPDDRRAGAIRASSARTGC